MNLQKKGCIIVPYRNRSEHLAEFLPHYSKLFPDMRIYVIEQADEKPFNRAKLLNVGYLEYGQHYDYAVYHDVDMLVVDGDYSYGEYPMQLATMCSQFSYQMPYQEYFGGVTLIPSHIMTAINGYPNEFWSWGGEDNMMYDTLKANNIPIKYRQTVYECFEHPRDIIKEHYNNNCAMLKHGRQPEDGLSSCLYDFVSEEIHTTHTLIKVKL